MITYKVKDYPNLRKENGYIVNIDHENYEKRIKKINERNRIKHNEKRLDNIEADIINIKSDISLMKNNINTIIDILKEIK